MVYKTHKKRKEKVEKMVWIILSVLAVVILFVTLGCDVMGDWKIRGRQILCVFGLALLIPGFIAKVPANSVGILYSPFSGTSEITMTEGFHGKNPFEKVYKISTEVQTMTVADLTTQTKDAQFISSTLDIKYRVSSANAYLVFTQFRTLDKMSDTLIIPTTQRVLELVTTKYNVIDVLGEQRSQIYAELQASLTEELAKYGVEFYSISITDMDAGEAIESAITAEAVAKKAVETAAQELLKAETEAKQQSVNAQAAQDAAKIQAETKIIQAEADAQIAVIEAQAEADAKVVAAEAEKKANEMIQQSLTDAVLQKQWIEAWSGNVPTYYGGDGADLIFNTGSVE